MQAQKASSKKNVPGSQPGPITINVNIHLDITVDKKQKPKTTNDRLLYCDCLLIPERVGLINYLVENHPTMGPMFKDASKNGTESETRKGETT